MHNHLTSYCIGQIYKSRLKHQVAFYCYQSQKPKVNTVPYNSFKKKVNKNEEEETSEFSQEKDELHSAIVRNQVEKWYPQPVVDLKSIYDTVNNEFGKDCISITYTQDEKNGKHRCTINITWPGEASFSEIASNKRNALYNASLSCLAWLCMNKRINRNKPVLYTNEDIGHYLETQNIVNVSVTPEWKQEMRSLIEDYNDRIKPVIKTQPNPPIAQVKEEQEEKEEIFSEEKDNLSEIMANQRNNILKNCVKREIEDLSINRYRQEILNSLANNQVTVIKGDTGCGKSTQVPQFIIDDYVAQGKGHECNIVVAEPRRISAVSLAHRVAWERNEKVGDVVGYHVRFDHATPQMGGSILYCTTGILLRRLEHDPTMEGVTHVIIDEAHERSLQTDMLLKYFKDMLKRNPRLKIVIMSASINAELFQRYFSCPTVEVPGKTYPVKMHFMEDIPILRQTQRYSKNVEVQYEDIVKLIKWITKEKPPGAILCFLPGWAEIKQMYNCLQEEGLRDLFVISLHSKIPINQQQKVFDAPPGNMTKVILSTDIAETGITIKDISYVIDTAIKRQLEWNEEKFLSSLNFSWISQASICQRKGRAGRVKPGESYHLISRREYEKLDPYPKPEILKIPLEEAIIISKTLKDEKAHDFFSGLIESPSKAAIDHGLNNLRKLNLLDDNEQLTSLGKRVSYFALQPKLSRAVILSCIFQCLDPVLSIATVFSTAMGPNVSLDETTSANALYKDQKQLYHKTSDHIAILQYYDSLQSKKQSLFDSFNDSPRDKNANAVKRLYLLHMNNLISTGMISTTFDYKYTNVYAKNNEMIRAVLFAATNHLVKRNPYGYKKGCFVRNANDFVDEDFEKVKLKTESVNYNRKTWPSETMTYINKMEFIKRRSCLITDTSIISPLTVLLFSQGETFYEDMDNIPKEDSVISINNIENVKVRCEKEAADLLLKFRSILWDVADYIITYEGENTNEDNLSLVKSYKEKLMPTLSKMLLESSRDIDNAIDEDDEDTIEN